MRNESAKIRGEISMKNVSIASLARFQPKFLIPLPFVFICTQSRSAREKTAVETNALIGIAGTNNFSRLITL